MSQSTPLDEIEEWPEELVQRLQQRWITTAEQVVAASATPGGITALAQQMGVPETETARLIDAARARLSAETVARLETPLDSTSRGLGALKPPSAGPRR
jgi:hypothetical protein